jgi:hypothetical protein
MLAAERTRLEACRGLVRHGKAQARLGVVDPQPRLARDTKKVGQNLAWPGQLRHPSGRETATQPTLVHQVHAVPSGVLRAHQLKQCSCRKLGDSLLFINARPYLSRLLSPIRSPFEFSLPLPSSHCPCPSPRPSHLGAVTSYYPSPSRHRSSETSHLGFSTS